MGLLEEMQQEQQGKKRVRCDTCRLLLLLGDEDKEDLRKALGNLNIDATTISAVLRENFQGKDLPLPGDASIQRHRRGAHSVE